MHKAWMTRTATLAATLFAVSCAAAPPAPAPTKQPTGTATTVKPVDVKAPILVSPTDVKPVAADLPPIKPLAGAYDRVALIWGFRFCAARPWVITVVDLGTRSIIARTMAGRPEEVWPYLPSPTGEACLKGACPTMTVFVPTPSSIAPSAGTPIMMGDPTKGRLLYPYTSASSTTGCNEPPMLSDADLLDLASRLSAARYR